MRRKMGYMKEDPLIQVSEQTSHNGPPTTLKATLKSTPAITGVTKALISAG